MPHLDAVISIISEEALLAPNENDARIDMINTLTANGQSHAVIINNLSRGKRVYCLLHARDSKDAPFNIPLAMTTATVKTESLTENFEREVPVVDISNIKINRDYAHYNVLASLVNGSIAAIDKSLARQGKLPLAYAQIYLPLGSPIEEPIEGCGFLPLTQTNRYHPARPDTLYVKPTCLSFEEKSELYNKLTLANNQETVTAIAVRYIQKSADNSLATQPTPPTMTTPPQETGAIS